MQERTKANEPNHILRIMQQAFDEFTELIIEAAAVDDSRKPTEPRIVIDPAKPTYLN